MRRTITSLLVLFMLLVVPATVGGCKKHIVVDPNASTTGDYLPLIIMALRGAESGASIMYMEGAHNQEKVPCVVGGVLKPVFGSSAQVVEQKGLMYPDVDIDISLCLALPEMDFATMEDAKQDVLPIIAAMIKNTLDLVAYYVDKLKAEDCVGATIAATGIDYLNGTVDPIINEIMTPTGHVVITGIPIDLSGCDETNTTMIGLMVKDWIAYVGR